MWKTCVSLSFKLWVSSVLALCLGHRSFHGVQLGHFQDGGFSAKSAYLGCDAQKDDNDVQHSMLAFNAATHSFFSVTLSAY